MFVRKMLKLSEIYCRLKMYYYLCIMEVVLLNVPQRSKQLNSKRIIMCYDFRKKLPLIVYIAHKTSTSEYILRPPTVTKLKNVVMIDNHIITIIIHSVIRKRCRE